MERTGSKYAARQRLHKGRNRFAQKTIVTGMDLVEDNIVSFRRQQLKIVCTLFAVSVSALCVDAIKIYL